MRQTPHLPPRDHRDNYTAGGAVVVALLAPVLVLALSALTLVLAAALGALTALLAGRIIDRLRSIRGAVGDSGEESERAKTKPMK
ncbi:MAG: hypothetical protein ACOCPZ_01435 [Natrialbaceae archaeon]